MEGFESLECDMIRQGSSPRPSLALTAVPHIGSSSHPPNQKSYFVNILIMEISPFAYITRTQGEF